MPVLNSSGYKPRNGVALSYGNSMLSFLRNNQIVFHSGCTIFHFPQGCIRAETFLPTSNLSVAGRVGLSFSQPRSHSMDTALVGREPVPQAHRGELQTKGPGTYPASSQPAPRERRAGVGI